MRTQVLILWRNYANFHIARCRSWKTYFSRSYKYRTNFPVNLLNFYIIYYLYYFYLFIILFNFILFIILFIIIYLFILKYFKRFVHFLTEILKYFRMTLSKQGIYHWTIHTRETVNSWVPAVRNNWLECYCFLLFFVFFLPETPTSEQSSSCSRVLRL